MALFSRKNKLSDLWMRIQSFKRLFTREFWNTIFRRPTDALTVVLVSKGQTAVRKIRLSPRALWVLKLGSAATVVALIASFFLFLDTAVEFPNRALLRDENAALRRELATLQGSLDMLQQSVERMNRFDQKLRALTEVGKEFEKMKGPQGQGGGDTEADEHTYDFGDFKVDASSLDLHEDTSKYLDTREQFLIRKVYSWIRRLYRDSELQEQSYEELFEVLKGREIQIAATPSVLPVQGWVTSHFGYRIDPFNGRRALHRGMDVAAREGAPVLAPADGVVTYAGSYGSYGNTVMLFHGFGLSTLFAHGEKVVVHIGQKVKRGEVIGYVGSSGRSTGAHLHYEVIVHGVPVDPRKYILDRSL